MVCFCLCGLSESGLNLSAIFFNTVDESSIWDLSMEFMSLVHELCVTQVYVYEPINNTIMLVL